MNVRLTQITFLLLILSSCKSLRPVASRSNQNNHSTTASRKKDSRFLDNVSITPGENKSSGYSYKKQSSYRKKYVANYTGNFNLEKADWLQIKYAIITDMPVEQLNNLDLLKQIDHWWGTRYCLGGNDESCIDCSAFTQIILRNVYGVDVPRTAQQQYDFSMHIKEEDLKEGDLVFFKSGRTISHVGLYVANNKFVQASTSDGVTITDLNDAYWSKKYVGAGRILK